MGVLLSAARRVIRAPENPMDRATIVSIYPKKIDEKKHTLTPGRFVIEAGSYENPSITVIGPASWWKEIADDEPLLEIPQGAITMADGIIRDYANGLLECNMADSMPGLFFLPGVWDLNSIREKHKNLLELANAKQRNWYVAMVRMADADWARSNGNPLAISDDQRMAARELGYTDKEWLRDSVARELVKCVACGSLRDNNYPICPTCKSVVDLKLAKDKGVITQPNA